jgi:phloretin hydrolase
MRPIKTSLTPEEEKKTYAKYFYQPLATPNPELITILEKGPMNPSKALMPENIAHLAEDGYDEVETGYCVCPNGTGYLAVNNIFPGATIEMLQWWFAWHCLEDMRYMLWYNKCHFGTFISDADRAKILDPNVPLAEKSHGITHHIIEDIGGGPDNIDISFLSPKDLGFDPAIVAQKHLALIGGNGTSQSRAGGPKIPTLMLHLYREIPSGVESRTRFWMGYQIKNGKICNMLPEGIRIPLEAPMGLAFHNVCEFSNLANILPSLYKEMNGHIG